MSAKPTLQQWLSRDALQQVLQALAFLATKYKAEELLHDVTFQSGRLKALEGQRIKNIISAEDDRMETAKIREALLQMCQGIPVEWSLDGLEIAPAALSAPAGINWKKYATSFAAGLALLGAVAEFSGYSVRDLFQKSDEMPAEKQPAAPKASTSGDNSPAVITNDGDVNINYGEPKTKKDTSNPAQPAKK